jgi:glycosyltransferase involved in cell wall biosynthesis
MTHPAERQAFLTVSTTIPSLSGGAPRGAFRRAIVAYDFGAINGGAAQVAIQSAIGLARRGYEVDYFCAVGPVEPALAASGVRTHCLNALEFAADRNVAPALVAGLWKPAASRALQELLRDADPASTIIHLHGWTKALSTSVVAQALASGIPTVVTLHEYFAVCPNGGFYDYQRHTPCGKRAMSAACVASHCDSRSYPHKVWRVLRQAVAKHAAGLPDAFAHVIYISTFSREILASYFGKKTQWHFVRNPIAVPYGPRVDAENNQDFLFLGRLSPEKGAELFAEAAARAGLPARLAGDGPDRIKIERAWPDARLAGWLDGAGVHEALSRSRALVFPSRWYETQGLSVYEALARGVPVIVSDASAARDAVRPGRNGLLFRSGDAADLAEKLLAMSDDRLVREMSVHAHEEAWRAPATIDAHLDALVATFERMLA